MIGSVFNGAWGRNEMAPIKGPCKTFPQIIYDVV